MTVEERLNQDYSELRKFLDKVTGRLRLFRAAEAGLWSASGLILVILVGLAAGAVKPYFSHGPFLLTLVSLLTFFFILALSVRRVISIPARPRVAVQVEASFPQLKDNLTNSLELVEEIRNGEAGGDLSRTLIMAQVSKTSRQLSSLSPKAVVDFKRIVALLKFVVPLFLAFLGTWALSPGSIRDSLSLLSRPWASLPPSKIIISLEPKGGIVAKGSQVTIKARASGKVPENMSLRVWPEKGEEVALAMEPEGEGKFRYLIDGVEKSFTYQAQSNGQGSSRYQIRVVPLPEVARVRLTYFPPEYSRLPNEVREQGHIEALKGTSVRMEVVPTKKVKEASIELSAGNAVSLKEGAGGLLKGSLIILSPGSYSIKLKDEFGFENREPVRYQIRLLPDQTPEVEIVSPAQDLTVDGNEILPLVYAARDDFGLTEVRLAFRTLAGKEQKISLKKASGERGLGREEYRWDLDSLALSPGERVTYRLEALDNDTISGPKEGYSKSFSLLVRDHRAEIAKANEGVKDVADALVNLLADHLEYSSGDASQTPREAKERITKKAEEILKQIDRNLERPKRKDEADSIMRYDMEVLRRNLSSAVERMPEASPETVTSELERMTLLADELAKRARMEEVQALAQDIRNRERNLLATLEELKGKLSKPGLEAALKELNQLRQLLSSLMDAMTKMAGRLPEDFVNSDALGNLEFQDLFKGLDEIEKRLRAGDLEGALQAARELLQSLTQMMAAMQMAGMEASSAPFGRMRGEMVDSTNELSRIMAEQRDILLETERIEKEAAKRSEEAAAEQLRDMKEQLRAALSELSGLVPSAEQEFRVGALAESLKRQELGKFLEESEKLEAELEEIDQGELSDHSDRSPGQALSLLEELRAELENLFPDPAKLMTESERRQLSALGRREKAIKERTQAIKQRLDILSQVLPMMDTQITRDMGEAANLMGQAETKLGKQDAPGAIPPERGALERLARTQQAMQGLSQQMAMRMGMQQRWGYQWGYDPRPGWYAGPWVPMPTLPQPELRGFRREQGYTGIEREEFQPPSKDDYKVPKMYREEVMKALKEGYPSEYERQIKRYFENLAE